MLVAAAPPPAQALAERLAPVLVLDRRETSPPAAVGAATVRVPGAPAGRRPTVYARVTAGRIQFWIFERDNPQDRGVVHTGRHEGDWELVQVERDGERPTRVLASQHSGAEACGWDAVRTVDGHPVIYLANGSHAGYFRAGTRDRTFPDPNDEARGDGRTIRPAVVLITARSPAWMRWPGRWGRTRARPIPFESDSPRGPAFQGVRWDDPAAFLRDATPCGAAAARPNRTEPIVGGAVVLVGLVTVLAARRRRRSRGGADGVSAGTGGGGTAS